MRVSVNRWALHFGHGHLEVLYLFPWSWVYEGSSYLWAYHPRDTDGWFLRVAGLEVFWRWP